MKKRFLAAALALAMLLMMVPSAFAASDGFDDVPGHWAEDAINRWSGYGVVNGVGDNQFAPNGTLTRAQAAQVFANLLDLEVQADISRYTDVPEGSWYHNAIAQCVAAGILTGTGGSAMDPQSPVTREELFVMFARALNIRPQSSSDVTFGDSGEVSGWAQGYINALADRGFVSGVGGGMLAPGEAINRASVMSLLDKTISDYANTSGTTVGNASGVVLVVADNVSVAGDVDTLVVYGGSASVTGSQVAEATVAGENASLSVSGSAVVERVDVAGTEAVLTLTGSVQAGQVTVSGESAQVSLSGQAQAASVAVEETAAGAGLTVGAGSAVTTVDSAAANVTISGSGTVETANVSGNNTTVNTDGTDLTVAQGTTGVTENDKPVSGGSTVETQPEQPVTPPIYIPNYYTVTFVNTDKEMIVSQTVVEHTTDLSDLAPDVTVGDGQQLKWHNGTSYVELSEVTVTSNLTLTAVVGSNAFTAGNGTETYPYLISDADELIAMGKLSNEMIAGTAYYFELVDDIYLDSHRATVSGDYNSICTGFRGEVEGNEHTIYSATNEHIYLIEDTYGDVTIRNLDIVQQGDLNFSLIYLVNRITSATGNVLVQDIEVQANGVIGTGNNIGSFVVDAFGTTGAGSDTDGTLTLDNCDNYADINVSGYAGVFLGGYNDNGYVTYTDCDNHGEISGEMVGLFTGNSWKNSTDYDTTRVTVEDCYNYGQMNGTVSCSAFASNNKKEALGYTQAQITYNQDNYGTNGINVNGGSMSVGDSDVDGLGLVVDKTNGTVSIDALDIDGVTYEMRVYAQNSFTREDGTSGGSSYVQLSEEGDQSITLPLIDKMVSSGLEGYTETVIGENAEREEYSNSRYVLIDSKDGADTMVVDKQDMINNFGDDDVSVVTLNSATRYTVVAKDSAGRTIASVTYWYNNLPAAETTNAENG